MDKTLPLYLGPSVIGSVVLKEENRYINIFARTFASLSGICRAYIQSADKKILIGVMSPTDTGFFAERKISKTAFAFDGLSIDDITYACAVRKDGVPTPTEHNWSELCVIPDILKKSNAVHALAISTGALCDSCDSPTKLALPLFTARPFPRPDMLGLLTPKEINGELYGIIGISKNGTPKRI